jgi:hypothetical protein
MANATVLEPTSDALITIPVETAFDIFASNDGTAIDPYLVQIRRKVDEFQPSLKTATSRKQIASMARKVSESKVYLEAIGKALADEQKEIPKRIDATRRKVKEYLDALRDEVRQPLTDWENAEEARVAGHLAAIARIRDLAAGAGLSVEALRQRLAEADSLIVSEAACHEFTGDYDAAKTEAIAALTDLIAKQERADAERAELEALRKEKAQRDAAEAERQRIEREAEAKRQAELAAEAAKKAAAERAELEKTLAAERAKNEALAANLAAQKEAERIATESAQRAAAEAAAKAKEEADERAAQAKREADTAHKGKVNRAAVAALVAGGIEESVAKAALKLIIQGKVPAVSISY